MSTDAVGLARPSRAASAVLIGAGLATIAGGVLVLDYGQPAARSPREILRETPMSSQAWLDMATQDFHETRTLGPKALRYLELSWETGPHEGQIMARRALLGVVAWEQLPAAFQKRVLVDLAASLTYLPEIPELQLRLVVAAKNDAARRELRAGLLGMQVAEQRIVGLGL